MEINENQNPSKTPLRKEVGKCSGLLRVSSPHIMKPDMMVRRRYMTTNGYSSKQLEITYLNHYVHLITSVNEVSEGERAIFIDF